MAQSLSLRAEYDEGPPYGLDNLLLKDYRRTHSRRSIGEEGLRPYLFGKEIGSPACRPEGVPESFKKIRLKPIIPIGYTYIEFFSGAAKGSWNSPGI